MTLKRHLIIGHDILISKLEIYGIKDKTLPWFKSYLSQRRQQVSIIKVSKVAKIRNRYNQVPHLTQDTNGTRQTRAKTSALSQQMTTKHIVKDAYKDIANTRQNKNVKDPQKKYTLERSVKYFTGGLQPV